MANSSSADTGVEAAPAFQSNAFQNSAFQTLPTSTPSPEAWLATGTGAAAGARPSVKVNAEAAAGTGAAHDATATAFFATYAPAGLASGAGVAYNATATAASTIQVATGTGAAHDAVVWADDNYGATPEGDIATGYMPPLAAPIDDNDTTIIVQYPSTTDPDVPFVVILDGEQMLVTDVSGTTWTVERGYDDTAATSHGAGTVARPALVRIRVGGVLISADVSYQRSRFTTAANGQPGVAEIWVRDLDRTRSFVTGAEVIVKFRGIRMWGGYIASIRRQYVFSAGTGNVGDEPRWLVLDCVDYNILFSKRIFFKPGDADRMAVRHWPNGTWDSVVISDLVNDYLTLGGDGLRYDIQHVGTPALPQISCNPDAPDVFGIGSAGWTWGEVMTSIVSQTGAVYYIDPDKVFRYVDDSDKQSRFGYEGLSDVPDVAGSSLETTTATDDFTRTVGSGWGTGALGTWATEGAATPSVDGDEALFVGSNFMYQTVPIPAGAAASDVWTLSFRFLPASGGLDSLGIELINAGSDFVSLYFNEAGSSDSLNVLSSGTIDDTASGLTFNRLQFGFLKLELDRTTGRARGKVWNDGGGEPDWQVDETDAALVGVTWTKLAIGRDANGVTTARWDWVAFEYEAEVVTEVATIGYRDVEFTSDGTRLTNDHLQWGAGQGSSEMVFSRVEDDDSIAAHGRWQTGELRYDLYCQDSVDRRAETWVYGSPQNRRGGKDNRFFSRVTVREPYFRVADVLVLQSTEFDFSVTVPVRASEITFPTPWDVTCVLTLAHELDAPWSTFEFWMPQFSWDPVFPTIGPGPGLDIPPFPDPWPPLDPCEDYGLGCIVEDTFDRSGASLGTSDSGHVWGVPIGITNDYTPTTDGSEAIFHVEPGFSATSPEVTHVGSGRLNLSGEGALTLPFTASFRFQYTGTWDSNWVQNPKTGSGDFWAPGFSLPDDPSENNGIGSGGGYRRNFLSIRFSNSIPIYRFNVYNSGGGLYVAAADSSATDGSTNGAVLTGSQLTSGVWCNVKIHADSDRFYIKVWPDGTGEPAHWQAETDAAGDTWADQEFEIVSRSQLEDSTTPPFTIRVDDLCIERTSFAGEALGLPGFGGGAPALAGGWTNTEGESLEISASGVTFRNVEDAVFFPAQHRWIVVDPTIIRYSESWERPEPLETIAFRATITRTSTPQTGTVRMVLAPPEVSFPGFGGDANWSSFTYSQNGFSGNPNNINLNSNLGALVTEMLPDTPYYWEAEASGNGTLGVRLWKVGETRPAIAMVNSTLTGTLDLGFSFYLQERSVVGTAESFSAANFTSDITISEASVDGAGVAVVDPGDPCADAEPGEFEDPLHDGPEVGDEPGDRLSEVGENGGVVFQLNAQFQLGSTEVWVDGLRIRLGSDYLEFPRNGKIEILDHIDVGTEEAPASIRVNYIIWTIDDPIPE